MGEAKRRREAEIREEGAAVKVDMHRVAAAVNKICWAASPHHSQNCLLQAELARDLLADLGVSAQIVAGAAAWRLGQADGDVLSHVPKPGFKPAHPNEVPFHAWLRIGGMIFDVTTADMREKATALDAQDGGRTNVDWAPPFLFVRVDQVSSYHDVAQGRAGLFFYQEDAYLTQLINDTINQNSRDAEDSRMVRLAYENPDANVFGPNMIEA